MPRGGKRQGAGRPKGSGKPKPPPDPIAAALRRKRPHGPIPGAGRPKGSKNAATIEKDLLRERLRRRVAKKWDALIDAQIANALGKRYLVTRDKKTGKFIRVTEAMAKHKQDLKENEEIIEVWEDDASILAFEKLTNWTIDKPKEPELDVNLNANVELQLVERLMAARQRRAANT